MLSVSLRSAAARAMGEIIPVGSRHSLDHADIAQASRLP